MTKSYHNFYSCKKYEVYYNKFCDDSNNHCDFIENKLHVLVLIGIELFFSFLYNTVMI